VNRELALFKAMLNKAVEWSRLKENPGEKVKLLKGTVKRVRFLMPEKVQILLSNCANHLKPIVTVAVHTGMRKGEILGLRRDQVNFEQGIISILDTKNHERRDIPMNETTKTTLKAIENRGPYLFCNEDGQRLKFIDEAFRAAVRRSGKKNFHFHDLRHTFTSNLVMTGEDLNTVAELLGHKNLEMTRRYAHLSPKFKKNAVNVLDRIMSLNPPQEEIPKKVVSLRL
jgi:integrase